MVESFPKEGHYPLSFFRNQRGSLLVFTSKQSSVQGDYWTAVGNEAVVNRPKAVSGFQHSGLLCFSVDFGVSICSQSAELHNEVYKSQWILRSQTSSDDDFKQLILGNDDFHPHAYFGKICTADVHHYPTITSTMAPAQDIAASNDVKAYLFLADEQTQGVGQGNNKWLSPKGDLFATLVLTGVVKPGGLGTQKDLIHTVTSLSVVQTLQQVGITQKVGIKYKNDVFLDGFKISGNLVIIDETHNGSSSKLTIGIGVGLNAQQSCYDSINSKVQVASSVFAKTGTTVDVARFVRLLTKQLFENLEQMLSPDGILKLLHEIDQYLLLKEQTVLLYKNTDLNLVDVQYQGIFKGLDVTGHANVEFDDGSTGAFGDFRMRELKEL